MNWDYVLFGAIVLGIIAIGIGWALKKSKARSIQQ